MGVGIIKSDCGLLLSARGHGGFYTPYRSPSLSRNGESIPNDPPLDNYILEIVLHPIEWR